MKDTQPVALIVAITGLAAGAFALTAAEGSPAEPPRVIKPLQHCGVAVSGAGRGRFRGPAEMEARSNWRKDTVAQYDPSYGDWNKALNSDVTCGHNGKKIKTWICTAFAVPCSDTATPPSTTSSTNTGTQPTCYPSISVEGDKAVLQTGAETNSLAAWRAQVASYGAAYQDWNKAIGRDVTCRHNGLGPAQRRWRCVRTAQPCK